MTPLGEFGPLAHRLHRVGMKPTPMNGSRASWRLTNGVRYTKRDNAFGFRVAGRLLECLESNPVFLAQAGMNVVFHKGNVAQNDELCYRVRSYLPFACFKTKSKLPYRM